MLQCQRCQQWFHQECIRNPNVPQLLLGDRFWEFVCTLCTGTTEEIVRRIHIGWVDAIHLILFNLIVANRKEHHHLETAIIPLFKKKLSILKTDSPSNTIKSSRLEPHFLEALLRQNKSRFKCGSKSKKSKFWTLNKVGPPLAPHNKAYQKDSVIDVNFKCHKNGLKRSRPALKSASFGPQKVRRRPKKESLDSLGDSSDTSSFGSLDSFIPRPKDFHGQNNPFRGPALFAENFDTPIFLRPSKRGRKYQRSPPASSLGSAGSSPHSSISSLSSTEAFSKPNPPVENIKEDLKWSLNSYFGANHRIARGEKFQVIAKRLNSNGDIQHLMAWDQPITKPFLINCSRKIDTIDD